MLATTAHRRPLVLLVGVVSLQVLLLAVQIRRANNMRLIRIWAVELFTPLQRAGTSVVDGIHSVWSGYVGLRHARQENEQLRAQLQKLQLRDASLESRAAEADRLAALLAFREAHGQVPMLPALVIGASPVATSHTVYINRGEQDGVRKNMGVMTPDGVVGKVVDVYRNSAQVLLLTDRESGVGALLEGSRTQGVVKGTGAPEPVMDYVVNDENVAPGTRILTSGMDRIFPKDLPVGTVVVAEQGNPFKLIRVQSAAHLDRLEEVLVLLTRQELETPAAGDSTGAKPPAKAPAPPR